MRNPLLLLFSISASYAAKEANENTILYAPLAGIHQTQSLFEPVLFSEKTPSTAKAYVADARNGGSGFAVSGLLPLFSSDEENKRSNGWALGIMAGYQRDALYANDIVVPAYSFYEAGFGRATTESWVIGNTGLRGYFEMTLRNQKPDHSIRQETRLAFVSRKIPNNNYFAVIRMGAGSDNTGTGIVTQKPGFFSWAIQTAYYAPLHDKQSYADIKVSPSLTCFSPHWICGLHFFYLHMLNGKKEPNSDHVSHWMSSSLFLKYHPSPRWQFDLDIFESFASGPADLGPRNFKTRSVRNTHSQIPGAKLAMSLGF